MGFLLTPWKPLALLSLADPGFGGIPFSGNSATAQIGETALTVSIDPK